MEKKERIGVCVWANHDSTAANLQKAYLSFPWILSFLQMGYFLSYPGTPDLPVEPQAGLALENVYPILSLVLRTGQLEEINLSASLCHLHCGDFSWAESVGVISFSRASWQHMEGKYFLRLSTDHSSTSAAVNFQTRVPSLPDPSSCQLKIRDQAQLLPLSHEALGQQVFVHKFLWRRRSFERTWCLVKNQVRISNPTETHRGLLPNLTPI